MNKYNKTVQVIDSLKYTKGDVKSYNSFHYDIMKIVSIANHEDFFFVLFH